MLPAPGARIAGKAGAGAVVVLYGGRAGLSVSRRATITQNTAGVPGTAEAHDGFGSATATADLNRDGYADPVVSAPYEDTTRGQDVGTVTVLWGSRSGLTSGTDLPAITAGKYYGLDVAALSTGAGVRTEVLVAGYEGAMRFRGPFSRSGTYGSADENRDTASVGSVALGDFAHSGVPDEVAVTVHRGGAGRPSGGGAGRPRRWRCVQGSALREGDTGSPRLRCGARSGAVGRACREDVSRTALRPTAPGPRRR